MNTMLRLIVSGLSEQIQSETQSGIDSLKPEINENINTETESKINDLKPELYDNINSTVETETRNKINELIPQIQQEIQNRIDNIDLNSIITNIVNNKIRNDDMEATTDLRSLNDIKNDFCISSNSEYQLLDYSYVFAKDPLHIETPLYDEVDFRPLTNGRPILTDNNDSYIITGNEWGTGYNIKVNRSIGILNIKISEKSNNKLLYYLGTFNGEHYYTVPAYLNFSCIINGPNIFNVYDILNLKKLYIKFNNDNSINDVSNSVSSTNNYYTQLLVYVSSSKLDNEYEFNIEIPLSSNILWFIDSFAYLSYKYDNNHNFDIENNYLYAYHSVDIFTGVYSGMSNFNLPNELLGNKYFLRTQYTIQKEYFS